MPSDQYSRRTFLASAAAAALGTLPPSGAAEGRTPGKPERRPLAAICTVHRPLSDAYHILGRFLHGYQRNGQLHTPGQYIASIYTDQAPENDLSRSLAREFNIRVCRTVDEALTGGTNRLTVDGALLIAEHGNYPRNDRDQILYPRFAFFDQAAAVFRRVGRSVPVFHHRFLSHDGEQAQQMVAAAAELGFPVLAGSSLPVTWRRPELELPLDAPLDEAVVAGHGPVEVFGYLALEALQAMMERRAGGETGVRAVTCLTGNEVWKAGDAGRWSWDLLHAALARSETVNPGDVRRNAGSMAVGATPRVPVTAFLVEYRDGRRGAALLLNGHIQDFVFAGKVATEARPASCLFQMPSAPGARHFDCLAQHLEQFFATGKTALPLARTLLAGGMLEAAMESRSRRGARVETPALEFAYRAPTDSGFVRGGVNGVA